MYDTTIFSSDKGDIQCFFLQAMEENDEELEGGWREDLGEPNDTTAATTTSLTPNLMSSLVISPSKSLTRPQPKVLSPIRKPSVSASQGGCMEDGEDKEGRTEDGLYDDPLGDTQNMRIHSSAVVKSSEVISC